jgi:hypothetical protein
MKSWQKALRFGSRQNRIRAVVLREFQPIIGLLVDLINDRERHEDKALSSVDDVCEMMIDLAEKMEKEVTDIRRNNCDHLTAVRTYVYNRMQVVFEGIESEYGDFLGLSKDSEVGVIPTRA